MEESTEVQEQVPEQPTEPEKDPSLKDLYDAVIQLTKEVGKLAKEQQETREAMDLKKKAGNF